MDREMEELLKYRFARAVETLEIARELISLVKKYFVEQGIEVSE